MRVAVVILAQLVPPTSLTIRTFLSCFLDALQLSAQRSTVGLQVHLLSHIFIWAYTRPAEIVMVIDRYTDIRPKRARQACCMPTECRLAYRLVPGFRSDESPPPLFCNRCASVLSPCRSKADHNV
jgi:hypothetical protein